MRIEIWSKVRTNRVSIAGNIVWSLAAVWSLSLLPSSGQEIDNAGSQVQRPGNDFQSNWPSFRGPGSNGHAVLADPPAHWSEENAKNIVWKSEISKHGMSSPVVWNDRVFLTGADDVSRDLYCFSATTGERVWVHSVRDLPDSPADGGLPNVLEATGFAAPTVSTNGRAVAAIFATGELVCVDLSGKRVWSKHLGIPTNHYGHASSLICDRDLLFVQYDQQENSKLLAFEMATGKLVWEVSREEMSWASPILIENGGRTELVLVDNRFVSSYKPATGERYWQIECLSGEVAPSAAFANGTIFVAVEESAATAIDVNDHSRQPTVIWQWDRELPDSSSPVATESFLVMPTAYGVVTCLNAKSGAVFWEHEFDRGFSSSPIVVGDRVFITDLSGRTQIFKLGSEFQSLGEADIGERVYATPAFVGRRIYVRGLNHLFCIGETSQ